jgi:chromosome segregation ATPase
MREADIQSRLDDLAKGSQATQIAQRKAELAATKTELENQPGWQELLADQARTRKELDQTRVEIHQLQDVNAADVARLRGLTSQAANELSSARVVARQRVQSELDALNQQIADINAKLKSLDAGATAPIAPVAIVQTVLGPIAVRYAKAFGAGDSPEEIVRILMKNKSDVLEEMKELTRTRAAAEEWTKVRMPETYTRLQACVVANRSATTVSSAAH